MTIAAGRVIVVGGGVIGASCAYYLSRDGWDVTVVDRGAFGKGCSHGNCGLICPSHILPLAGPGAIRGAIRAMLSRNAAFAIRPRIDPSLWDWLLRFTRRCTRAKMLQAGRAIQALLISSRTLYAELMKGEPFDCEWEEHGLLYVLQTAAGMEHFADTARLLHDEFGMESTRYDGDAVLGLEPALRPGLAGGWHFHADAQLRPDRLMASWRRVLEARGVRIREQCEVIGFTSSDGRARAAVTPQEELPAEAFVVAAGALTPRLARQLAAPVPIQPGKGYSITMARPAKCPQVPLILDEHHVAVTPMQSGYRLGSTMEFAGYDTSLNPRRLDILREGARHYLQEPYAEPVEEEWYGWRPMTPDSVPIIDHSPALPNVLVAAGHNMLGVSMSPGTGKLVAEMLGGAVPHTDVMPYSLARFGAWWS
jgi:D-amino-acid dehydrogenase